MELRDYQLKAIKSVKDAWDAGAQNVCLQLATGAGKTVIMSEVLKNHKSGGALAIAHRCELVSQISLALARAEVRHDIIASKTTKQEIVKIQYEELGKSFYRADASVAVASIDTLIRAGIRTDVTLIVQDEAHHVLKNNKFGRVSQMYPEAKGLYLTATPVRADRKGLGRQARGVIDELVTVISTKELMQRGYLTPYRIFAPKTHIDLVHVATSASGDFSPAQLRAAVHKSNIVGDVVAHYLRLAAGKTGVTFAVDIDHAHELAHLYNASSVPTAMISSKTKDLERAQLMRRFRAGDIKQIVNVDILGEGVDVPAIEVVSFARPTQSYSLYSQQFGRALRPLPDKTHAVIIDHVGNVMRHGLPEVTPVWTLDGTNTMSSKVTIKTCTSCFSVYERVKSECPYCRVKPIPESRTSIEHVDGDLLELDPEMLALMRAKIDPPLRIPYGASPIIAGAIRKKHEARKCAQAVLRDAMATWELELKLRSLGLTRSEIYRRFYHNFEIDMLSAKSLAARDALVLAQSILCKKTK